MGLTIYGSYASIKDKNGLIENDFKIESAKDLDVVKEILFIRDTEREKKDTKYDEIDYGGCDNSRYISNASIKLKTGVWYELAVDIVLSATFKNDGLYLYQNYDTSSFMFEYMYPIYIKELK